MEDGCLVGLAAGAIFLGRVLAMTLGLRLPCCRDLAAYAAGVSTSCRRREASPRGKAESLFSCWPKRKVTQRVWSQEPGLVALRWDKLERLRMVVAWQPPPPQSGYFQALRNAPRRRGLKAFNATVHALRFSVGAHPVRDKPTKRYRRGACRAQGALPQGIRQLRGSDLFYLCLCLCLCFGFGFGFGSGSGSGPALLAPGVPV